MNQVSLLLDRMHDVFRPISLSCPLRKRSNSFHSVGSDPWVTRESPHVPGDKLMRSASLISRLRRSRFAEELGLRLHIERSSIPMSSSPYEEDDDSNSNSNGNSDKEQRQPGTPTTYTSNRCIPFEPSAKRDVEAEFQRLKIRGDELMSTARAWEEGYKPLRRLFFEASGRDWTASQWAVFLFIEAGFFQSRDKLFAAQDEIQRVEALGNLYVQTPQLSSRGGLWFAEGDATVWSLGRADEERVRDGEYPALEWNHVDYNAVNRRYSLLQASQSRE